MTTTFAINPRRAPEGEPYESAEHEDLAAFYARHPELQPTPLRALPAFARALGIGELHLKDESSRFGLNAFKSLGVRYAVDRLRREGRISDGATLTCASAGNHGRAVARIAREHGLSARVYLSNSAAEAPRAAIAAEGAEVVIIDGAYEDAVHRMAADAEAHGWTIVSDTSWSGYEEIPRLIMLGYSWLVTELRQQMSSAPDVVVAQGGVGGLVAGVAVGLPREFGPDAPALVACEPVGAACLLVSARAGKAARVNGPVETIMAGLRCGEPSGAAWDILADRVAAFVTVDDGDAVAAMRMLARPLGRDPVITAGPSGACGIAALVRMMRDPALASVRDALDLGSRSSVVAINTEGATDPAIYAKLVG